MSLFNSVFKIHFRHGVIVVVHFFGAPPYQFTVADPVLRFIKDKMNFYRDRSDIKPTAPIIPGKRAVIFCTYSGPHTGIRKAIPAVKYMGQFFEHLGFTTAGEWYIVGEFHREEILSTQEYLGISGDVLIKETWP